jgi:hypothetical protein
MEGVSCSVARRAEDFVFQILTASRAGTMAGVTMCRDLESQCEWALGETTIPSVDEGT